MVVNLHIQFVERSVPDSCVLASLRDPSRRVLRARDTRYARVAGLAARGGLAAAPPPQLTRNGATAPLLCPHGVAMRPRANYSLREFPAADKIHHSFFYYMIPNSKLFCLHFNKSYAYPLIFD